MTQYNVTVELWRTGEILETVGEFYSLGSAEYQAIKASRRFTSPDVVAVMRYHSATTGTPRQKSWRMGRVFRNLTD